VSKLKNNLRYRLNENEREAPNGKLSKSADMKQFLAYTIRGNSTIRTKDSMKLSPFEILSFILKVELSHMFENDACVRFNFHLHSDSLTNLSFKDDCDCMPEFNLIKSQCTTTIGKEDKDG
jgi:hypothetical protein